ncbi:sugar (pentulose or hexulose) kinase [Novosphingobium chloroacetimidivorans]|uniref:Sugar (Pentulose or hexulose) kinase n=1 Tax=Novosphingobium chloroacetimidivorans TaxID=1428314 RepID=A0A7W7KB34_9SPHN|nr:carbohydrate kinase [Novosphingobium chloroacetimidivorans]MBB4859216.1 sugar (pentulose or hexulose) kinase [Novosphingobium chloroacetimidivorans]
MTERGATIVVDIGKTLSKVTLWTRDGRMIDRQARPNVVLKQDGIRRLDHDGIAAWLRVTLARYADQPIEVIVPVGHGAGFVALGPDGPAFAPFDYEQVVPEDVAASYRQERDPFGQTGSPLLPAGLNLGAQVYWAERLYPKAMTTATLLPWAQYWAWWLSGEAVSEVTSLGCHSDLWSPGTGRFSDMAQRLGWAERFAPIARAQDTVGKIRPTLAEATGLPGSVAVLAGIHDSNAALLAARGFLDIARAEATVLSTGTWFVAMRRPASVMTDSCLPEGRDTLINVDAYGWPVPSGRFMGGREIEQVIEIDTRRVDITPDQPRLLGAVPEVLTNGAMLLPTLAPGCGPFPDGSSSWIAYPKDWYARRAAACLYAALVADTTLDLIGSRDRLLVEGRFAEAEVFVRALASLRPDTQVFVANAHNDVSFGALRLINPMLAAPGGLRRVEPLAGDLTGYRQRWREAVGAFA